jgi:Fe-S oxidoreductase
VWEWLWEKFQTGAIKVERPIERKVVLTDSCYGSELGDRFLDAVRGLHRAVGMEVVELANNRFDNLTCGTVAMFRKHFDLMEGAKEAQKKMAQILNTKVGDLSCYCPGCYRQLRGAAQACHIQIHYALEEILWALGDDVPVPFEERAGQQTAFFMKKVKASFTP